MQARTGATQTIDIVARDLQTLGKRQPRIEHHHRGHQLGD
jgi:hypothetical protein